MRFVQQWRTYPTDKAKRLPIERPALIVDTRTPAEAFEYERATARWMVLYTEVPPREEQ